MRYDHSPDEAVLTIQHSGGMSSVEIEFARPPDLVLTGDGTLFVADDDSGRSGIVARLRIGHVSAYAVDTRLWGAYDADLMRSPHDYSTDAEIFDAGSVRLRVSAMGGSWSHSAYALDEQGAGSLPRWRLAHFVGMTLSWGRGVDDLELLQPTSLALLARVVDETELSPAHPAWPEWPASGSLSLDRLATQECSVVNDPEAVALLTHEESRYYAQGDRTYELTARAAIPGQGCGPGPT
jgi:hypothetical protein